MQTDANRLEAYLTKLKKAKGQLPSHADQSRPHISRISVASGIPQRFFYTPEGRRRLNLAIQEIGLGAKEDSALEVRLEGYADYVGRHLRRLESHGIKLPEHPTRRGEVFLSQLAVEAGLHPGILGARRLRKEGSRYSDLIKMIESAVPRLGVEVRVLTQHVEGLRETLTYETLLEKGTEERRLELENKPNATQQLYNTRSKLRLFCASLGLDSTAAVGDEFAAGFEASVDKVLSGIESVSSRRKFHTEINRWSDYYRRMVKTDSLPEDFHDAFRRLVDMSGLSLSMLGKLLSLSESTVGEWYRGRKTPRRESIAAVSRMEAFCKLPAGALVGKLPRHLQRRRISLPQLPESLRKNERLAYRVCKHLPDNFPDLSPERQQEVFDSIRNNVLRHNTPYSIRQAELRQLPYSLKAWPAAAAEEFEELASFKTAESPPLGMRRKGRWKSSSIKMARSEFASFLGALRLPVDAADARIRGLGVPDEHLTVALIACPLVVDWFIRFRCGVRAQYTEYTIKMLTDFTSLLRAETGWLRQMPHLANRLRPISCGETILLSPELIRRARSDWDGVCQEAIEYYKYLRHDDLKDKISVGRDPFLPIDGIVKMDDPTEAFELLLQGMRDELPNLKTQPVRYHAAIRDLALVALIAVTGFRRNTVAQLDFTCDESGHLTLRGDCVLLDVPRYLFKDPNSPFFGSQKAKVDYSNAAPDVFGIVDIFKEYLTVSRPFLLRTFHPEGVEQPLFVNAVKGRSARMSPEYVSGIYRRMAEWHLAENEWRGTGIREVRASGSHSARHIRGTAVVKETGSYQLAGDANQHSAKTAEKYYSRFATEDRNRRVNKVLFGKRTKQMSEPR